MLHLQQICKKYRTQHIETMALNQINLTVNSGEFIAILGPSGCGKSTLLNTIGLLDRPTSGDYSVNNHQVCFQQKKHTNALRLQTFGFVFQSFYLIDDLTVFENLMLGLKYRSLDNKAQRVTEILHKLGIDHRAEHYPCQLSGGQQQRCAVGRALVSNPKVILADEPTGNLDEDSSAQVISLLTQLNEEGTTVIMVTHSESIAEVASRVIRMKAGEIQR